jgi:hypothetical protein
MRMNDFFDFAESDVDCPPQDLTLKGNEEETYKQLAEANRRCFDDFWQGRLSLFDVEKGGSEHFCVICAYLHFEAGGEKLSGYPMYTMKTTMPGSDITYFEFFTGRPPNSADRIDAEANPSFIDTSQDYVVLFTYAKNKGYWDKFGGQIGLGAGLAMGGMAAISMVLSPFTFGASAYIFVVVAGTAIGTTAGGTMGPLVDVDWSAGLEMIPFTSQGLVEQKCYRLEQ